ncbi:MAG: SDR family oxidoreductase [Burkholderiaceae bacterium]
MKTVFIAGATGYLGRFLCSEYKSRGWHVRALVRDAARAQNLDADDLVEAQATRSTTLAGKLDGAELVISALGITRQTDGLQYRDVDYQANLNLLAEALRAGAKRFTYIHVLNADRMPTVPLVKAKAEFVRALQAAEIPSTIIAPSGYFSDMTDFLEMARRGRVWVFGAGSFRINPIHGADLSVATANAIAQECSWLNIGGPDSFTHVELGKTAFAAINKPVRISHLPDLLRKAALLALPWLTPKRIYGPAQFFLTAMGMNMTGEPRGTHRLADHFAQLSINENTANPTPAMNQELSDDT